MSDRDTANRLESALRLAREAGRGILRHYVRCSERRAANPEIKSDGTPVTHADREAERLIRDSIEREFPADGVLGEEYGESRGESGYRWVVDPIDGTASFICGVPLFGTLIGIERDGCPVAGVIHLPALGETVSGGPGMGATHVIDGRAPRAARVSAVASLREAMLVTTSMDYFQLAGKSALYHDLVSTSRMTRGFGDAYAFALVATGRADYCIEPGVKPWDIAAVAPVIQGAGGLWSDFSGEMRTDQGCIIATNGVLQSQALSVVARHA